MAINKYIAPDGYVYTNGTDYGKIIVLGCNDTIDRYELITEQAYADILAVQERVTNTVLNSDEPYEAVYDLLEEVV